MWWVKMENLRRMLCWFCEAVYFSRHFGEEKGGVANVLSVPKKRESGLHLMCNTVMP
eukprot:GDKH01016272.1.p8 GENE.GDKH01016272.1~~GDKH01016272.1.p8  ORF type:complete len:57 (+),score=7.00 GDKH01016272.1:855-1025(+)